jgi:cytidylate kinase
MVVTITRQFGAGGSRVAQLVADGLGWSLVDNEFVDQVAERAGLPPETVAAKQERAPSLMERLVRAFAGSSPEAFIPEGATSDEPAEERIVRTTERIIAEAAAQQRVVLVGRAAQFVLGNAKPEDALHVYLVAPRDSRIRVVMEREGLTEADAAELTDRTDADRDRYVRRWYQRDRQNPANYHMVLNTGWLGYPGAARLIHEAARGRGWIS